MPPQDNHGPEASGPPTPPPDGPRDDDGDGLSLLDPRGVMSFGDHLEELRRRLIYAVLTLAVAFVVMFFFRNTIMGLVLDPVEVALAKEGFAEPDRAQSGPNIFAKSPLEGLITMFKILAIAALFVAAPLVGYQFWAFVAAGLYPREKRMVYLFAPMTIGLFMAGVVFSYYGMLRVALPYMIGFVRDFVQPMYFVQETAMFIVRVCLVMGLVFQIPLIILFIVKIRLVSVATIVHYRRHCYVATFIVSALITPPEVYTQIAMAVPMIVLIEFGILLGRWSERSRRKQEAAGAEVDGMDT